MSVASGAITLMRTTVARRARLIPAADAGSGLPDPAPGRSWSTVAMDIGSLSGVGGSRVPGTAFTPWDLTGEGRGSHRGEVYRQGIPQRGAAPYGGRCEQP
ncbi:hypothetical protein GCM10023153_12900 [Ornithinibacter aureus]|uniref:Uncharacterized protein n=1 Tax=Ornithinibacter aureus TaxID=622664 RepID=A0ABP8JN18_9MICO